MARCFLFACLALSFIILGCGSSTGTDGAGGTAGLGGMGGTGATGGTGEIRLTSISQIIESGLTHQLLVCQCPDFLGLGSENACLASADNLGFSDRQVRCIDELIASNESLSNRFNCLFQADLDAIDCVERVVACSEISLTACADERLVAQEACPPPDSDVNQAGARCVETTPEDAVDAFLDAFAARCDCQSTCTSADLPSSFVQICMVAAVTDQAATLGAGSGAALECAADDSRALEVCFGNETMCDGFVQCTPPLDCPIDLDAVFSDCAMP